jgi:ABC-type transporter Mla maintaining outer membrane lipid asymmetry ATPase subunit MlaF
MSGEILLELNGLRAKAGETEILKGLDLTVRRERSTPSWGPTAPGKARFRR